ncbi:type III-A CRISPR-associated RAMP protein Csm3 [Benzoatithermus flavus]|uniref:CRISPR system Cms endoribonuclease Csm3 n=1 Tax=Benzoatithermus flavus TaxID=3108223 RepID=A0ABU8XW49_9PROT
MDIKAIGRARIEGKIKLLSGLHIGAGKDTIEIGGIDNPVVKHPHTQEPYIPGSSLKGRLRFILEWAFDCVRTDGQPWGFNTGDPRQSFTPDDPILRIFGSPAKREQWGGGPTRLIVRDAFLDRGWLEDVLARGLPLTEDKTEVLIDRIAGKAHDRVGPRQTERVPAGAVFDLAMVFRLYDTGDGGRRDRECLRWLLAGLSLLEQDALGGSGSRGYGRVTFEDLTVVDENGAVHEIGAAFRVNRFDPQTAPAIAGLP